MITSQHNDGSCFKITLEYTDYEDSSPFEKYIRYGENFDECLEHAVVERKRIENELGYYIIDFRIQDDSK